MENQTETSEHNLLSNEVFGAVDKAQMKTSDDNQIKRKVLTTIQFKCK